MKLIVYGGTGMVGQGVLREFLAADDVTEVLAVGRRPVETEHPRLTNLVLNDLTDYSAVEDRLRDYDGCFFALGVSSTGMHEADYTAISYDLTLAAAETLSRLNPDSTFCYISGAGSDSSESGRIMWARVKGRTENALLRLPFRGVFLFRPGLIYGGQEDTSSTPLYAAAYKVLNPVLGMVRRVAPGLVLSTSDIGQAALSVIRTGAPKHFLEVRDIRALVPAR